MTELADARTKEHTAVRTVVPGTAMIAVTFGLARYGYGLLLPDMRADIHMTAGAAGFISAGAYLAYLLANAGVVTVVTRWGPRVAVGSAALCAVVGMSVVATSHSLVSLALGVMVAGAAAGLAFPPYADIVSREVRTGSRDVAWSTISSGTGWGVAIAGPVAVVAGDHWRAVWMLFVVLAVIVGVLAVLAAPVRETRRTARPRLSYTWFVCPSSRPLLLSAVLIGVGSSVWWAFSVDALRQSGVESTAARLTYAGCGAAGLLASFSGLAFAKVGLRAGYLVTCATLAVSLVLFGAGISDLTAAALSALTFGVAYNCVIAAQGVWSSRVFADHPAAGLAAVNTALTIGFLVGPPLGGIVIERAGYTPTFLLLGAVVAAALPFCPPSARRRTALARHRTQCTAAAAKQ